MKRINEIKKCSLLLPEENLNYQRERLINLRKIIILMSDTNLTHEDILSYWFDDVMKEWFYENHNNYIEVIEEWEEEYDPDGWYEFSIEELYKIDENTFYEVIEKFEKLVVELLNGWKKEDFYR